MPQYTITIIIPTCNEAKYIGKLITYLKKYGGDAVTEIIVADCGSDDETIVLAKAAEARVIISPQKGRAAQMNYAASLANGNIFYFVHADSLPPASFAKDILQAVENGFEIGRYQTKFDSSLWMLKLNAFFTRFDWFVCYGADQTIFATKALFNKINGYNANLLLMEEYDFTKRAKQIAAYKIFKATTLVSARKYKHNSWLKVQLANRKIVKQYHKGIPQQAMMEAYKKMLRW